MSPTMQFMNELNDWYSKGELRSLQVYVCKWCPETDTIDAVVNLVRAGLEILESNPELTHVNIERGSIVGFR